MRSLRSRRSIAFSIAAVALLSSDVMKETNAAGRRKHRGGAHSIGAASSVGRELLSRATFVKSRKHREQRRFLEEEDEEEESEEESEEENSEESAEEEEDDASYLASYSIKFQGCNTIVEWNDDGDGGDGEDEEGGGEDKEEGQGQGGEAGKYSTKKLVRLRLCPAEYCVDDYRDGCKGHYGEYVVDLETYVGAWMEWITEQQGQEDEQDEQDENEDADRKLEDGDEQDQDQDQQADFDFEQFSQCSQYGDDGYYVGPYCTDDGNKVGLGVFTDDECTVSADEQDFHELTEYALEFAVPYSGSDSSVGGVPVIPSTCVRCQQQDAQDGDEGGVNEMCQEVHDSSAKCETLMLNVEYPNEYGCEYIEGLRAHAGDAASENKLAIVLIVVFGVSTVLMAVFAFRLKKRVDRATVGINAKDGNDELL